MDHQVGAERSDHTMAMPDSVEKVTGQTKYVADETLPGMLHVRPVFSPHAHAEIVAIDTTRALEVPGVVAVLTAEDLPAAGKQPTNRNSAILARDRIVFQGQPVAVVVGESEAAAQDGAEAVTVEYDAQPAASAPLAAMAEGAPLVWPEGFGEEDNGAAEAHAGGVGGGKGEEVGGNVVETIHFERGDVETGFAEADVILERTYRTPIVHQGYMEPHAAIAKVEPFDDKLTIWTSTQGQFWVRDEVAELLDLPKRNVRIVPLKVGGGFGAKYGILEPLLGAVALHLEQPVRLVLSRSEDFLTTTPSPACVIEVKTGAKRDGSLTAIQARLVLDSGAFPSKLTGIASILLGGYYRFPNLDIHGYEVLTHKPMVGAYRAPTAPQATFAIESQMDEMARELDLDPLAFRLQNAIETGDPMPNGDPWPSVGVKDCLERVANHPLWQDRESVGDHRGVGLAIGGWPGGTSPASAVCRVDSDGTINVHVGSVDINGTNTALALIAADVLDVAPEEIQILPGDTDQGPFAGPSGGSMITYTVGSAVARAAEETRQQLLAIASDLLEANPADLEIEDGWIAVRGVPSTRISVSEVAEETMALGGKYEPVVGRGGSAITEQAPGFTAHLVEVEVDPDTGQVRVVNNVIAQDVGHAINPPLVEGQVYGGAAQGLGWGLLESLTYDENGQLLTGTFMDYALPSAHDVPDFEALLVENPAPNGPLGARGVGEPPIVAGAAATSNAIREATGVRVDELPITPERLWRQLHQGQAE